MEVLLRQDVEKLGRRGQVVDVARGYARNYLMPRGLATKATEKNKEQLEQERQAQARREQQRLQGLARLAEKIQSTSCTVAAQAGPEGHLFGSVGPEQVARAFQDEGLPVDPAMVKLDSPIKEVGVFTITVQITSEHQAVTRVWVVPE